MRAGTKEFYRSGYYAEHSAPDQAAMHHHEVLLGRLTAFLPKLDDAVVLDLGCNLGQFLPALRSRWHRIIGLDISEQALKVAAKAFPEVGFVQGDLGHGLPLEDKCLDLVFGFGILEHLSDVEMALKEVRRVLGPDGRAVFLQCYRLDTYRHIIDWFRGLPGIRWLRRRYGGGKPPLAEMHVNQLSPTEWIESFKRCGFHVERRLVTGVLPPIYDFIALIDPLKILAPIRRYLRYRIYELPILKHLDNWCSRRRLISDTLARDFIYILSPATGDAA